MLGELLGGVGGQEARPDAGGGDDGGVGGGMSGRGKCTEAAEDGPAGGGAADAEERAHRLACSGVGVGFLEVEVAAERRKGLDGGTALFMVSYWA